MYRFRANYLSNGKLADYLRKKVGVEKPAYATTTGWGDWKKEYKTNHPIMYYITEKLLNKIQDVIELPSDAWSTARSWYLNKYKYKLHYLQTGLKPGTYYDVDTRLEAGIFETFAQFVEIDMAYEYQNFFLGSKKLYRSGEDGLKMLDYRIKDESTCEENIQAYKDIREIYLYIKNIYQPEHDYRDDKKQVPALYRFIAEKDIKYGSHILSTRNKYTPEELESYEFLSHQAGLIEAAEEKLKQHMLMKIISLRGHLWS